MFDWIRTNVTRIIGVWGFAASVAALVGFVVQLVAPNEVKLSSSTLALISTAAAGLFVGVIFHVASSAKETYFATPRIFRFIPSEAGGGRLLTASVDWLGPSSTCSIYILEGELELLIGFGAVLTIQQNKKIQIGVTRFSEGTDTYWSSIESNTATTLAAIILKPGLPMEARNV